MKRDIEVVVNVQQTRTITVEFPVYTSRNDSSDNGEWDRRTRFNADGSSVSIMRRRSYGRSQVDWQIDINPNARLSAADVGAASSWATDASTAEEFNAFLAELRAAIAGL